MPCAVLFALNHWLWLLLVHLLCFMLHSSTHYAFCYTLMLHSHATRHSSSVPLSCVPLSSLSLSTLLFFFQDKGYFESKIISVGTWSVGVCKQEAHAHSDLSKVSSLLSSLLCRVLNFPRLSALVALLTCLAMCVYESLLLACLHGPVHARAHTHTVKDSLATIGLFSSWYFSQEGASC